MADALYDTIGVGYRNTRQPDPRIDSAIRRELGDAATILNVGAGTGSYEPHDRTVIAVEPSLTMIRQRPVAAAPVIQANAMALPFRDAVFDASLAVLTVHHWPDRVKGLREMRRVSGNRVVILTWDPESPGFWLTDYFPTIMDIDRHIFPTAQEFRAAFGATRVVRLPIPADCTDGFLCAWWCRPEAYLDPTVRASISTFSKIGDLTQGLARLQRDLASGQWHSRWGDLQQSAELDLGYRLVVSDAAAG